MTIKSDFPRPVVDAFHNIDMALKHRKDWHVLSTNQSGRFVEVGSGAFNQLSTLQNSVTWLGYDWKQISWRSLPLKNKLILMQFFRTAISGSSYIWFSGKLNFQGKLWNETFQIVQKKWRIDKLDGKIYKISTLHKNKESAQHAGITWIDQSFLVLEVEASKSFNVWINPKNVSKLDSLPIPDMVLLTDQDKYFDENAFHTLEELYQPLILAPANMRTVFFNTKSFSFSNECYQLRGCLQSHNGLYSGLFFHRRNDRIEGNIEFNIALDSIVPSVEKELESKPLALCKHPLKDEDNVPLIVKTFAISNMCRKKRHTLSFGITCFYPTSHYFNMVILGDFPCCCQSAIFGHCSNILIYLEKNVDVLFLSFSSLSKISVMNPDRVLDNILKIFEPKKIVIYEKSENLFDGCVFKKVIDECGFDFQFLEQEQKSSLF